MHKNDTYTKILRALGLSKQASFVYLYLLRAGESLPVDIARALHVHRPAVYKALEELKERQLVLLTSAGKRTVYVAESPAKLEHLFHAIEQDFLDSIEDMHKELEAGSTKPVVSIQEGPEAVKNSYSEMIHSLGKNETYYRYSALASIKKDKYVPKDYETVRDRKGLERLVITGTRNVPHMKRLGRAVKVVPKEFDLFQDGINFILYKDKSVITDFHSDTTITIKHKVFAEFQIKLFKLLFSKL
jgi:sugar-specific transcriptional regulator TrmB